jgi:hypothetical protein
VHDGAASRELPYPSDRQQTLPDDDHSTRHRGRESVSRRTVRSAHDDVDLRSGPDVEHAQADPSVLRGALRM